MTRVVGALLVGALMLGGHLAFANLLSAPGQLMNEQRGASKALPQTGAILVQTGSKILVNAGVVLLIQ